MPLILQRSNPLAYPAGVAPGLYPTHVAASNIAFSAVALGNSFVSLPGGRAGTITSTPVAALISALGPSVNFDSTSDDVRFTHTTAALTTCTHAAICQFVTVGAYQGLVESSTTNAATLLCIGGTTKFGLYTSAAGEYASTVTPVAGTPYFVAASLNASTINFVVTNLGTGSIVPTTLAFSGTIAAPVATAAIGNNVGGGNQHTHGYVAAAMLNRSYIPMHQLLQWAADPWSFWYPRRQFDRVGATAAGFPWWAVNNNPGVIGTGVY